MSDDTNRADAIRTLAYQCAGAGAGAVMQHAPDVVMPSEKIAEVVEELLAEFAEAIKETT